MTSTKLLRNGVVVDTVPEPAVLGRADVLIEDGLIAAVGPDLDAPGAEVIDASERIVLPGFVDTHRHTWQAGIRAILPDSTLQTYMERVFGRLVPRYRAQDVHAGVLAGALECLDAGVTTVLDWSHIQLSPAHTEANVSALRESGVRAVFGYCYGGPGGPEALAAETRRVHKEYFETPDALLTMAFAALGPDLVQEERALAEWRTARDLGLPVTAHLGGHGAESAARGLAFLQDNGLIAHPTTHVHANCYTDEALERIARNGGTVSVSPAVEATMGFGAPPTGRARAAGIPTALSADTVSNGAGDMFSLMRAAYMLERGRPDGAGMGFTTRDVLRMATIEGAEVAGLAGVTGSLTPGKQADVQLLRTDTLGMACAYDPIAAVVLAADTAAVDTVLVGGEVVKRGGALTRHDVPSVLEALAESAGHVTAA